MEKIKKDLCKNYKKCGGCQLLNLTYNEQLRHKQVLEIKLLGKFQHVDEIIGMENPYHYRCKVQSAFGMNRNKPVCGIYQSSTHKIVPTLNCLIEDSASDKILSTIYSLVKKYKISVFNEETNIGFLRHVLIRKGYYTNEFLIVFVTTKEAFLNKEKIVEELVQIHPEITTIVQNINNKYTSMVLGDKDIVLYGNGFIQDRILGNTFRISPQSFYQVNPQMTQVLYSLAKDFADIGKDDVVLDAYCGTGTIGIVVSNNAKKVIGVELNKDAIKDAKENALINNVNNIDFVCADAEKFILDLVDFKYKIDVAIIDPPRTGSTFNFVKCLCKLKPKRIVYVSCNPETLSRDLNWFVKDKYVVKKIQPVDMFPHTKHVETVVALSLKK